MASLYKNQSLINKIFVILILGVLSLSLASAASPTTIKPGGILPVCDPASPDFRPGGAGCGEDDLRKLIINVIKWINIVIIPIAVIMIGLGGFYILTAAGSTERIKKGKETITIAVIGVIIFLSSYLIIKYIFEGLGVETVDIEPGSI